MAALVTVSILAAAGSADAGVLSGWLAIEDPVERCPVLVVLNGDQPARVDEAARLYRAGFGGEIWLTNDPRSGNATIADAGTYSNAERLVGRGGVPRTAVHVVPGLATSTRAELEIIGAELRRRALSCAVLVTSPLHARRVKATWERVVGTSPRAVVRHAPGAGHVGWSVEMRELGGVLRAWIGLPR